MGLNRFGAFLPLHVVQFNFAHIGLQRTTAAAKAYLQHVVRHNYPTTTTQ